MHIIAALNAREYKQTILGGVKMSVVKIDQNAESGNEKIMCIDTGTYLDDVELAKAISKMRTKMEENSKTRILCSACGIF